MNNVREWISDYLRYILLGLILILLSVLIFITIRRLEERHARRAAEGSAYSSAESAASEEERTAAPEEESAARTLIANYYNALAMQNTDALRSLVDELSEAEATALENHVPTQYHDVSALIKPGPDEDTLAAAVTYTYEELGSSGPVPDIRSFLLKKKNDGSYVIRNGVLTGSEQQFLSEFASDPDVAALVKKTQEAKNAAAAPSPTPVPTPVPTAMPARVSESDGSGNPFTEGAEYTVNTDCNLREEADYDAEILEVLSEGQTVTVTGYDDGWVKVETDGLSGYMGQDFLS